MAKRGRKRIEIDYIEFEKLCGLQCTLGEIAAWFQTSEDTIERRVKEHYKKNFADVYKKYSSTGKISLRRYQFTLAKKYPAMAIFLGKQLLGQRDRFNDVDPDIELTVEFDK